METVAIHDRIAGIRLRLSETENPVKWYRANTSTGNGVYGVDAANLAIFDVGGLFGLSHIKKERLFNAWRLSDTPPQLLSLMGDDDCVITSTGFGDGCYPAFWGVNQQEEVISLYIDFMILVEETESGAFATL